MTDEDLIKNIVEPVEKITKHLEETVKKFGDSHTDTRDMAVPAYGFYVHPFHWQSMREEIMEDAYGEVYGHWYLQALDKIDLEEILQDA